MVTLHRIKETKKRRHFRRYLKAINEIMSSSRWENHTYNKHNVEDVYVILSNDAVIGLVEIEEEPAHENDSPFLNLRSLYIIPGMQRRGIGTDVIKHFLEKGLEIELCFDRRNTKMLGLINKLKYGVSYDHGSKQIVRVKPD